MPNGLSTIRRGVGYGPLGTMSRGYLGQFAIPFSVKCPPVLSAASLEPAILVLGLEPGLTAALMEPDLFAALMEPGLTAALTEPALLGENCS